MLVAVVTKPEEIAKIGGLADLIELRLDYFDDLKRVPQTPLPCIYTLRKEEQGGARPIPEKERLALIEKLLEKEPAYCDIEADTDPAFIEKIAKKFPKTKLIGSYHNFKETPRDLDAVLASMKNRAFSIYKIAVQAESTLDMLKLMVLAREAKVPLSVMSMGEYGKPSRIIAPIAGSVLNYASLEEDPQLHRYSLQILHDVFHYRKLNRNTLIFSLIGDPVEQSPGDLYHNPRFAQNAVYIKMRLSGQEVGEFFQLIKELPFGGLSVTIPLKEALFHEVDEVDPAARAIGAINTVTFRNKRAYAANTDAPGALNAIEKHVAVKGKTVALLGAGGTARAIAYEAKKRGAKVEIYNRTLSRAKELAQEFSCSAYALEELSERRYDILVNTIPPKNTDLPSIRPNSVVMDVVYYPRETPLLREAKKRGCECIYGEEMFNEQAELQQREWKDLRP